MALNELGIELTKQEFKFNYSFTGLAFATLALSVQFSPLFGKAWPWLLIVSWTFLLIAAIVSGYRLVRKIEFLHVNVLKNDAFGKGDLIVSKAAAEKLRILDIIMTVQYQFSIWIFILGVACNLIFAARNYLK